MIQASQSHQMMITLEVGAVGKCKRTVRSGRGANGARGCEVPNGVVKQEQGAEEGICVHGERVHTGV